MRTKTTYQQRDLTSLVLCLFSFVFSYAQPTITSFAPVSGLVGATVAITGTNFNTTPANNRVYFGAAIASVSAATATSLTVTVPSGATYGYITVTNLGTNLTAYSRDPFLVTCNCTGALSFASKVDFTVGTGNGWPFTVVMGDLDADGKTDLATANYNENLVSAIRNSSTPGTLSFSASINYGTNTQPNDVSLGDIDGDGLLDMVTTATSATKASPYQNTSSPGTISFNSKTDQSAGTQPYSSKIIDFDGDGRPDIVTSNVGGNNVSVLRSTSSGPGSFGYAAPVNIATGTYPSKIAVGDLDGDGKPEIVTSNFTNSNISVLRNTCSPGAISFAAAVNYATGANPEYIAIGDLNADGKPELAIGNRNTNNVLIFRNNCSPGTISFAAGVGFATGAYPYGVAMGDLNGDGLPDLAVANYTSKSVSVLRNTSSAGSISFAAKVDYSIIQAVGNTCGFGVAIGDLDGDDLPDIAATNECGSNISILRNQCSALPAGMLSFSVQPADGNVLLEWSTASETNNDYFSVERSIDGKEFFSIGTVKGSGNSPSARHYKFTDSYYLLLNTQYPVPHTLYYRLKQADYDGSHSYSEAVSVSLVVRLGFAITGLHAADGTLDVRFALPSENLVTYELLDAAGRRLLSGCLGRMKEGNHSASIPAALLPAGIYGFVLRTNEGAVYKYVSNK